MPMSPTNGPVVADQLAEDDVVVARSGPADYVVDVSGEPPVGTAQRWSSVVVDTLTCEAAPGGSLDVFFVDVATMTELNQQHMGASGPTDVLAFPLDDDNSVPVAGMRHLGDVVICSEVAAANATTHAGTVEAEVALLIIHGVLHILGHDHAASDEAAVMAERESVNLAREGHPHPGPQQ